MLLINRLYTHSLSEREAIYFSGEKKTVTYKELLNSAKNYGGSLKKFGIKEGDIVLIFLPTSKECIDIFLGVMFIGAIPSLMPLPSDKQDHDIYWKSHESLFNHIADGWILSPQYFKDKIRSHSIESMIVFSPNDLELEHQENLFNYDLENIAFLQHSSGTTGLKKGVPITHKQLYRQINSYKNSINIDEDSVIVSWLPLYHDMGFIACFLMPLFIGCKLVIIDPFRWSARPRILFEEIDKHAGTHCWMPNFAFSHMANIASSVSENISLRSMEKFINCSEHCKPESFKKFLEAFSHLGVNREMLNCCYAMAETVFAVTQTDSNPSQPENNTLSSGRPIDGVEIRIISDNGTIINDEGQTGEIQIRSNFIFNGYYKNNQKTKDVFEGEWYKTMDYGFIKNGELFIQGRLDDMIIINGKNIYSHEIESEIYSVNGVIIGRSVAFSIENTISSTDSLIIVCETHFAENSLLRDLKQRIYNHVFNTISVMPREILLVPPKSILKTSSGKTDRKKNKHRYLEGQFVEIKS